MSHGLKQFTTERMVATSVSGTTVIARIVDPVEPGVFGSSAHLAHRKLICPAHRFAATLRHLPAITRFRRFSAIFAFVFIFLGHEPLPDNVKSCFSLHHR
jgi:hypothetical protein